MRLPNLTSLIRRMTYGKYRKILWRGKLKDTSLTVDSLKFYIAGKEVKPSDLGGLKEVEMIIEEREDDKR